MAGLSKITIERNQKILLDLVTQPGNDLCADCKVRNPRWASWNLGIFICVNCASIHRKIGTHITKVKSITMDTWSKEQVEPMKSIGNIKSNALYNPNEVRNPPPPNLMDVERDSELENYIRSKYQFKRFIDKKALVASKLGPSRSTASVSSNGGLPSNGNSQSNSTPLTSAVSTPSVPTVTQAHNLVPRRSTIANTATPQNHPQPLSTSQHQRQPPAQPQGLEAISTSSNGVWADLVSLKTPSSSSSLPLQFQTPLQTPLTTQGYQMQMATGINPFHHQQPASNPYSQQLYPTSSIQTSSFSSGTQSLPFGSAQQSFFSTQQPLMSAPAVQAQTQNNTSANFFHPQPQQALQVQVPSAGQALFAAGNGSFMSAPATQGRFLSTSPAQYPSQSPQQMISTTPQPHMYSTTPQPQMFSMTPQPQHQQQLQAMPQFMSTPSQQFQMQQQGGLGLSQLHGQMSMGQQAHFGQSSGQFGGTFQQAPQPFSTGSFGSSQQWGAL